MGNGTGTGTSNEKLKEIVDYSNNKGPYGLLAALVASIIALAQLNHGQLDTLRELWPIVSTPAGLLMLSTPLLWSLKIILFDKVGKNIVLWVDAFLRDQANRTAAELKIHEKLEKLANQFEQMLANHWEDRRYFDEQMDRFKVRFNTLDERTQLIHKAIEKRSGRILHNGK